MDHFKLRLHKRENHQFTSQQCCSSNPLPTREVDLEPSHLRWLSSFKCLQAGSPLKFTHTELNYTQTLWSTQKSKSSITLWFTVMINRHKIPTPSSRSKLKGWRGICSETYMVPFIAWQSCLKISQVAWLWTSIVAMQKSGSRLIRYP